MMGIDPKEDGYQQKELDGRRKFFCAFSGAPDVISIEFTSPLDRYNPADARMNSGGTYFWVTIKTRDDAKRYDDWIVDTKNLNEILERKNKKERIAFVNIYRDEVMLWNARQTTGKINRWAVRSSIEDQGRKLKQYNLFPDSTCYRVKL